MTEALTQPGEAYWTVPADRLLGQLGSRPGGLSSAEAAARLRRYGPNRLTEQRPLRRLRVLLSQLKSPLLLLLLLAAVVSLASGEWTDAGIVVIIVVVSAGVGYHREYRAQTAAAALRARVRTRARVLRDAQPCELGVEEIVPGDVVLLFAGSLVPADGVLLEATDCYASEAVLTGESFPVPKQVGPSPAEAPLARRGGCLFLGTNVRSGFARLLVVHTGAATEFGQIAQRLSLRPPETEFDRGLRRFGYLLTIAMLMMVVVVFAAHVLQQRPAVETLLFAIALAVGLSPELLPAILSVNLARGAEQMARRGVLVRHLSAIESLGSMDVLCTDKTGTLTEGVVRLDAAFPAGAGDAGQVLELGALNAALETGLASPLDDAILERLRPDCSGLRKRGEIPFDFVRKRVSVVVQDAAGLRIITKGAFAQVLEICDRTLDGQPLDQEARDELRRRHDQWSGQGIRVLAVAVAPLDDKPSYSREDERQLALAGFLTFLDRPKEGVGKAIAELQGLGVALKLITGDSQLVAQHLAAAVGLHAERILTGAQLDQLHDEALWREAERTDLFVEVDPNQKERIILALRKMGHVVGFLGDGVNDAPAMHAADTSLSVQQAADVAREAADFVLLERDLGVIREGIEQGRRTFANTLKYVLTTTSANLGNMVSMAVASLVLPFMPLTAGQILLNNLLSDIPAVGLAGDSVDVELVARPRRWDMRFIGRFMVEFGLLSSLFDLLTFAVLLVVFSAGVTQFRTAWFVESLLTELLVALVVRTRRSILRSRPGRVLLGSTVALVVVALGLPYLPGIGALGFEPLPASLVATLVVIAVLYVMAAERLKRWFYRLGDAGEP
jgi:Mg2+-importing ATPase